MSERIECAGVAIRATISSTASIRKFDGHYTIMKVLSGKVWYTFDGTTPTASGANTFEVGTGEVISFRNTSIQAISDSAGAIVNYLQYED